MAFGITLPWDPLVKSVQYYSTIYNVIGKNKTPMALGVAIPFTFMTALSGVEYFIDKKRNPIGDLAFSNYLQLGTDAPNQPEIYNKFQTNMTSFIWLVLARMGTSFVSTLVGKISCRYMYWKMASKIHDGLFTDQNIVKASYALETKDEKEKKDVLTSLTSYRDMMYFISRDASNYITTGLKYALQGGIGCYSLYSTYKSGNFSARIFIAPFVLNLGVSIIISYFAKHSAAYQQSAKDSHINYSKKIQSAINNATSVFIGNAVKEIKEDSIKDLKNSEIANLKFEISNALQGTIAGNLSFLSNFISYMSFGRALFLGQLTHIERAGIETALEKIIIFLGYGNEEAHNIKNAENNLKGINKLLEILRKEYKKAELGYRKDNQLHFNNFEMNLTRATDDTKYTLSFNDISLEPGNICLIKGPSGCGKSTLIAQLVMLIQRDYVKTSGKIEYPSECNGANSVVMVEQSNVSFYGYTLRQMFLHGISEDARKGANDKISDVLKELGIKEHFGGNRLDEPVDFGKNLSGGQQKLAKLVNAILKQPKILILDESLTGLDAAVKKRAQDVIKKRFKSSIVIGITHDNIESSQSAENSKDEKEKLEPFFTHMLEIKENEITKRTESQQVGLRKL